ncbi:LEAF RUST 10 DISEASE-RESISTANCE LOCUS RECEPTOR-LIKE PROTEIN KINASE-like 1.4 isoform X4 [Mercurialis annua]|uniref:LEAF RUST 10 DISEASE-RESISTANCE LOCUS RECEPTOR-LIKE PROTEIN KINASE-like 1.4 isoform X4 n=1 Tax=Mercurialis annua TaxID=3986 RepID=UPI002160E601|nr:LEAF RUST 10 DISEASE-RESISTANCE LOCUS RECEPTOR-LIKE PROTEIN KINASE-like 1.4 isoform X4 [Mercurialis annua]
MLPSAATFRFSPTITIIVFRFFVNLMSTSFASNHTSLPNCNQTYSCGHFTNVYYPFSGGLRPAYCGLPGFQLTCLHNATSVLTINSLNYQVLELNQIVQTLILTRLDLNNTACTNQLINTTFSNTLYSFESIHNEILSLFYGCDDSALPSKPPNLFACEIYGKKDAYYWFGPVPNDPILSRFHCNITLTVPVLKSSIPILENNPSFLGDVLRGGFNVSYNNPFANDCADCFRSGGHCGFDLSSGRPLCICKNDQPCPGGNSSKAPIAIGLSVAGVAVVVGIGLGVWFLLFVQRRKRASSPTSSKDLLTPPSSKSQSAPVTNFSQTIPSYPSSKSDLEKGSLYFGTQVFSYDELVEATDNFDPSRELGDGGFGTVYYGVLNDGRIVAVKRLFENNIKRAEQFMNEIEILTRLRHKNLVALYGCTSKRSRELVLVYEYISNGTVADHLHGNRTKSSLLPWKVRLSIAIETADALAYLHASDVIHRDVKTNNILLDSNFSVKVADFGLSRLFPNDVSHVSTAPQGTPGYVDPEYYQCYQLTDKSDVYSFGVVLTELLSSLQAVDTSRHRLDINLANMAVSKIQNHAINELVDPMLGFEKDYLVRKMTTSVAELAFRCLQQEKDMRPTMAEVLQALKKIESEDFGSEKVEVLDIKDDDAVLLNHVAPFSPDDESIPTDKWVSSSSITTNTTISF